MRGGKLFIRGDVSSQYISALLMIAPSLKGGMELELTGKIGSRPYIEMTLSLMQHFGVSHQWQGNRIHIPEQLYQPNDYRIEGDWSGASYWYSIAALAEKAKIEIEGLRDKSWQGDRQIAEVMRHFGVKTNFETDRIVLRKKEVEKPAKPLKLDFTHFPDMAQTVAVVAAATAIPVRMSGLESLRIKETDRIAALQNELKKFGVEMVEGPEGIFSLHGNFRPTTEPLATYEDHRMAMAFAPLALLQQGLLIEDEMVVNKSYPEFWEHMELAGGKVDYL